MSRPSAAALACLAAVAVLAASAAGAAWPPPAPVTVALPDDVDAVVLSDARRVRFDRGVSPALWLDREVRLVVLTPAGRRFARVTIPLDDATKLARFEASSYGPGDRLPELSGLGEVVTVAVAGPASAPLPGRSYAQVVVRGVDPGDVVEYRYALRLRRADAVPDMVLGAEIPVLESSIHVERRDDRPVRWHFARDGEAVAFEPTVEDGGWRWRVADLPAWPGPRPDPRAPRLRIVTDAHAGGTPEGVAAWYRTLDTPGDALPASLIPGSIERARGAAPRGAARAVVEAARAALLAIEPPPGGAPFVARRAHEVLVDGYGESHDFATLTRAFGRALGLRFEPVLVSSVAKGPIDAQRPGVGAYDRVIVAIELDGGWVYSDPSDPRGAFGELGWALQGRPALRVGPRTVEAVTLPVAPADHNAMTVDVALADDGALTARARAAGLLAAPWRRAAVLGDPLPALARATLLDPPGAAVEAVEASDPSEAGAVDVTARLRWPGPWIALGEGREGLPLSALVAAPPPVDAVGPPRVLRRTITLPWPAGGEVPADEAVRTAAGSSVLTARVEGDRLVLSHALRVEAGAALDGAPDPERAALDAHVTALRRRLVVRRVGGGPAR